MASSTGTIKRITDKGFGFIAAPDGVEYFFHQSACTSTPFDAMREGDSVTFSRSARARRARAPRTSHPPSGLRTRIPVTVRPSGFEPLSGPEERRRAR